MLVSAEGRATELEGSDMPIGWLEGAGFTDRVRKLTPGDRLYVYSDGLTEVPNADTELFGRARLCETLAACRRASLPDSLDEILRRAGEWCGGDWQDDVSLLALEIAAG